MSARWFYRLFFGLFMLAAGSNLALAQVNVNAKLSTQEVLIGDQVRLTVQISLPTDLKFKAVKIKEALQAVPKIELVQKGTLLTVAESPQQILEQQYLLSSYEAGTYQIPAITVDYEEGGFIKSASAIAGLQLKVNSIPVNPERDTLRAIKNINREEVRFSDFLMPILIVLILLGLVIFTIRYFSRNRRKQQAETYTPPPPPPPAHETALAKLAELEQSGLLEKSEVNEFQTQLTYILREYLEGQYGVKALESTTDDILESLRNIPIPEEWRMPLRQMLQTADLVKFAKAQPPLSFHLEALSSVKTFVEQTHTGTEPTI